MLNRSTLHRAKPRTKVVEIPEWADDSGPMKVTIRELSAAQILKFSEMPQDKFSSVRPIAASVIDENGDLVFADTEEGFNEILSLSMAGSLTLVRAINAFNGIGEPPKN